MSSRGYAVTGRSGVSRAATRVTMVLAAGALMVGCVPSTSSPQQAVDQSATPSSTSASPTTDPTKAVRAEADRLAASYDYGKAVRLLKGVAGSESQISTIEAAKAAAKRFPDNTTISHLFYHSLIVDTKRAFASPTAKGYDDYMATVGEFRAHLEDLYDRGYVLVSPERIGQLDETGTMVPSPIYLPPGKTPLVLSIDDVSYYEYMQSDGFAQRLVVNPRGEVVNDYVDATGQKHQGRYDVVPIVDDFVKRHPDFSYRGDKGTIGLTGYNGVLGYRTSVREYGDTPTTRSEIAKATKVATAMRADGWRFASHSWGHINFTTDSVASLRADAQRWRTEVEPIVGETKELIFPFGADISGMTPYGEANPKYALLHNEFGFDYFFPIDTSVPAWMQFSGASLRQARINVDGLSMGRALKNKNSVLWKFIDVKRSIDHSRPSLG